ncbi:MAG: hypothetical protein ACT4P9_02780 [Betaproteobacteria bacterium]
MIHEERHCLADGRLLEIALDAPGRYRLRFGRPGRWLVSYEDGRRMVKGRRQPYVFRSVEQLRYDFEKDVENAQREA